MSDVPPVPQTAQEAPPRASSYPSFVLNAADERRWDLSVATAVRAMGEAETHPSVAQMAREMFHSSIPTDGPGPGGEDAPPHVAAA